MRIINVQQRKFSGASLLFVLTTLLAACELTPFVQTCSSDRECASSERCDAALGACVQGSGEGTLPGGVDAGDSDSTTPDGGSSLTAP
jgi:hypothetical protein